MVLACRFKGSGLEGLRDLEVQLARLYPHHAQDTGLLLRNLLQVAAIRKSPDLLYTFFLWKFKSRPLNSKSGWLPEDRKILGLMFGAQTRSC